MKNIQGENNNPIIKGQQNVLSTKYLQFRELKDVEFRKIL